MADVAPSLDQLRAEIDRIDGDLLRLLGERVAIGRRVAAAKGDATGPFLRPGREAAILRRLVETADEAVPAAVIERIWREILAANLARQVNPVTVVWDPSAAGGIEMLARDRGGVSTAIHRVDSAKAAIDAVCAGDAQMAVLPSLENTAWRWWPLLLADRSPKPRVIARLPFFGTGEAALGVGAQDPDPSGDDVTLYALPGTQADALDMAEGPDGRTWSLMQQAGYAGHHDAAAHITAGACPIGVHARPYSR